MQSHLDHLTETRTCDELIILSENFSIDFQTIRKRLTWHLPIKPGFDDLRKCARAAQFSIACEAQCSRITRNFRTQKRFRSAGQPIFSFVLAYFGDRELWRVLRDRMRVRFQSANRICRGKRVEIAVTDRFDNILELLG